MRRYGSSVTTSANTDVRGVSAGERLGLQNGRANEWMTELHVPVVQLHEIGQLGGLERVDRRPRCVRARTVAAKISARSSRKWYRGDQKRPRVSPGPRSDRRPANARSRRAVSGGVSALADMSDRARARHKFDQCQRIAERRGTDLVESCPADTDTRCFEHLAGCRFAELGDVEFVETGHVERPGEAVPCCPDDDDRIATDPTCHECERGLRGAVEPLHVVDAHEERPGRRELSEQVQHCERDQERFRSRTDHGPERLGEDRVAQVAERRARPAWDGEAHTTPHTGARPRFHAGRPEHEEAGGVGVISGCSQQRRLPDAGVADHQEGAPCSTAPSIRR